MDYEMEELFPIVSMLAKKYTHNESTSVTYERAQELLGGVPSGGGSCTCTKSDVCKGAVSGWGKDFDAKGDGDCKHIQCAIGTV